MIDSRFHSQSTVGAPDESLAKEILSRIVSGEPLDLRDMAETHPQHIEALERILPSLKLFARIAKDRKAADSSSNPPDPENKPPTPEFPVLGDFRILRQVGCGGMGVVFEAEQISLKRHVALKILPFAGSLDERHLLRFKNEACAAACLTHPHIAAVYSVGCEQELHFYAMQFIQGETLSKFIPPTNSFSGTRLSSTTQGKIRPVEDLTSTKQIRSVDPQEIDRHQDATLHVASSKPLKKHEGYLPVPLHSSGEFAVNDQFSSVVKLQSSSRRFETIAEWGLQIAEALAYAHSVGIIHRDVKPGNIIIDTMGKAWIMDFGIALIRGDSNVTMTGDLLGTLRYMSPEQAAGNKGVLDHRTDIYSLGVTLYELCAQKPLFQADDRGHLLQRVLNDVPEFLRSIDATIPRDLATIIHKAIEREASDRYRTAGEMAEDLRRFLADLPILSKPPSISDHLRKLYRRNRPLFRLAEAYAAILLVMLIVSSVLVRREQERTAEERRSRIHEQTVAALAHENVQANRYVTNINLADHALRTGETAKAREFLKQAIPEAGLNDDRGFTWYLLAHQVALTPPSFGSHTGDAYGSSISADGRQVATCGQDGVRVWNTETGEQVCHLDEHDSDVNGVSFSADGKWLASASDDKTVRIWSTTDWSCLQVIPHNVEVVSAVFSPDSTLLATGERLSISSEDQQPQGLVQFWQSGTWHKAGADLSDHTRELQSLCFSDDGSFVATGSSDGTACIWNVAERTLYRRLQCARPDDVTAVVSCVAFAHHLPLFATVGTSALKGYVQLWNLNDGRPIARLPGGFQDFQGVAFSNDDSTVAACGNENVVNAWKIRPDGSYTDVDQFHTTSRVWSVSFFGPSEIIITKKDGAIRRRVLFDRSRTKRIRCPEPFHPSFEFHPDGDSLVVANGGLEVHSLSGRAATRQLALPSEKIRLVALSEEGNVYATLCADNRVSFRDKEGRVLNYTAMLPGDFRRIAFVDHGRFLAATSRVQVDLIDSNTAALVFSRVLSTSPNVSAIIDSVPSGETYGTLIGNGVLDLWHRGKRLWSIDGIGDVLTPLQFSDDGSLVALCRADGVVQIWHVESPQKTITLVGRFNHRATLGFSADLRTLAGLYGDGTIKLWSVATGRELLTLEANLRECGRVEFSPAGNALVVTGVNDHGDFEIVAWHFDRDATLTEAISCH